MKTAILPYNQFNILLKKIVDHTRVPLLRPMAYSGPGIQKQLSKLVQQQVSLPNLSSKSARTYLSGAITEGIKQNFMGTDINAEFLLLSIGVYSRNLLKYFAEHQPKLNFKN